MKETNTTSTAPAGPWTDGDVLGLLGELHATLTRGGAQC